MKRKRIPLNAKFMIKKSEIMWLENANKNARKAFLRQLIQKRRIRIAI